jgi:hypothetical protein
VFTSQHAEHAVDSTDTLSFRCPVQLAQSSVQSSDLEPKVLDRMSSGKMQTHQVLRRHC